MTASKEFHIKAHYYLALIIALCLPVARLTPVFIALMFLNWLIEGDFKNKFQIIAKNKLALLFILFYVMHLIGLIYTGNIDSGLFDLQVKLSLFIFPLLLASRPLNKEQIRIIFIAFIAGGILSSFIMLSRAIYTYTIFGENNFFYQAFSFLIHPSYLSMYFNLCIAWLLLNILGPMKGLKPSKPISILIILFFSFIIVLLSSKMGLLIMVMQYVGFTIWFIIISKRYVLGTAGLALIALSAFSLVHFVPEIGDRVNNAIAAMSNSTINQAEAESTAVRMLIWKAANQVITDNFFIGAGTGDSRDVLVQEYEKRGMTGALEHKLNAHNEFYQVFVSIGLIGFLIFILSLLIPLFSAFKTKNAIYILFLLMLILNFIPESMFETQAGVMFYAFFNSLFCFGKNNANG